MDIRRPSGAALQGVLGRVGMASGPKLARRPSLCVPERPVVGSTMASEFWVAENWANHAVRLSILRSEPLVRCNI